MEGVRQPLFVVDTPYPGTPRVVCYRSTWFDKLTPAGRVGPDTRDLVVRTLAKPDLVCAGTSNPGYLAFVNRTAVSGGAGAPFVVFVDPQGRPLPAVASIGYRRDFRDLGRHTSLWTPPPIAGTASRT